MKLTTLSLAIAGTAMVSAAPRYRDTLPSCAIYPHLGINDPSTYTYEIKFDASNAGCFSFESQIKSLDCSSYSCTPISGLSGVQIHLDVKESSATHAAIVSALDTAWPGIDFASHGYCNLATETAVSRRTIQDRDEPTFTTGVCFVYSHGGPDNLLDYEVTMNSIPFSGANCGKDGMIMDIITSRTGADPNTWDCKESGGGILMTFTAGGDEKAQLQVIPALKDAYPTVVVNEGLYCRPNIRPYPGQNWK